MFGDFRGTDWVTTDQISDYSIQTLEPGLRTRIADFRIVRRTSRMRRLAWGAAATFSMPQTLRWRLPATLSERNRLARIWGEDLRETLLPNLGIFLRYARCVRLSKDPIGGGRTSNKSASLCPYDLAMPGTASFVKFGGLSSVYAGEGVSGSGAWGGRDNGNSKGTGTSRRRAC
jgi:hypothetical protein